MNPFSYIVPQCWNSLKFKMRVSTLSSSSFSEFRSNVPEHRENMTTMSKITVSLVIHSFIGSWSVCFTLSAGQSLLAFLFTHLTFITSLQISVKVRHHNLTALCGKAGPSVSEEHNPLNPQTQNLC